MYNWESNKKGRKTKKTGTVVFHPDSRIETDFDAYTRTSKMSSSKHSGEGEEKIDVQLMTEETAEILQKKPFKFDGLLPGQAQCYRGIYKARDVILHSMTGSGKTLAYALPLIERRLTSEKPQGHAKTANPFLLIFVFSVELAFQTKSVLENIYGERGIRFGIAGVDSFDETIPEVIIGTVDSIDEAIRGADADAGVPKRKRGQAEAESEDDNDDAANESDEDEREPGDTIIDVSGVRAIVVDEVDTTLGPRFSKTGKRMKLLLKAIRRANGSLTDQLTSDFRSHHYVLCGATIPNWVIKAGFLGNKKYYYQLVQVGLNKLPPQLDCYVLNTEDAEKQSTIIELVKQNEKKRLCIFTTSKQLPSLEKTLKANASKHVGVRSLDQKKDELQRVQDIAEYNSKAANVIICTDVAARGLDFTDVDLVVMDNLPSHTMAAEVFVHRAGRTARVNKKGSVVVLCDTAKDDQSVRSIEAATHIAFKRMTLGGKGQTTVMSLKVGSAFNSEATPVATATNVLQKSLGDEMFSKVTGLKEVEDKPQVTFSFPTENLETLKKSLWKYDLREVRN